MNILSQIEELLDLEIRNDGDEAEEFTSSLVRRGFRRYIEELLEAEVTEYLGREPYERQDGDSGGYRNGYKERKVDTAEGRVPVNVHPGQRCPRDVQIEDLAGSETPYGGT